MRAARAAGRVALDTEFLWERTYAPVPCLIQISDGQAIWLIDPVEGAPLEPLADLLADDAVVKVMHAPASDLTLFALRFGGGQAAIRDTQTAAGFVGLGAGASLGTLLERCLGRVLAKTESYSDWSRRPLSEAQLDYAADDVRYLLDLDDEIERRAIERGRGPWVDEEVARRFGAETRWSTDPDDAWRRVKGQGRLSGPERAALRSLAAWREDSARRRDRPLQWVLPDRVLVELARRRPKDRSGLASIRGLPEGLAASDRDVILTGLIESRTATAPAAPPAVPPERRDRVEMLGTLGSALLAARGAALDIAPSLVASREEIGQLMLAVVEGREPEGQLMGGWRAEVAGRALVALANGRVALVPHHEPPYVRELPAGD